MQDAELIAAVRSGDREAFDVLVGRHRAGVYRLCRRMAGNAPDAEDLAHQAFVEAWLKLHQLRDPDRFGAWLRIIVMNTCRMWLRRRKRDPETLDVETEAPAATGDGPSMRAQVALGLTRLPAPHRLVLVLHYLEGLSYKELSDFLDVPQGTVMSRLYRARASLRGILDELGEEEEEHVSLGDEFAREVDAEIGVLLRMSEGERRKAERLSAVLERSPDRLARLIREGDDSLLEDLARLMPRLGAPAVRVALELRASDAPEDRERAQTLLERSVACMKGRALGPEGSSSGAMPPRYAYILLDGVIAAPLAAGEKTDLLLRLLDAAEEEGTAVLITNLVLCTPEEAFERLFARFREADDPEDLFRSPDLFHALCRTGARFAEALPPLLRSGDTRLVRLALAGVEGLARARNPEFLRDASPARWANEVRTRRKWAPLSNERLPESLVDALAAHVAERVDDSRAPVRESALRTLGLLKAQAQVDTVRRAAAHGDVTTRTAALVALGEIGDTGALDLLAGAAASQEASERRAAVEVLSRFKAGEVRPLLGRLLNDPDAGVRQAAVLALGELGEPEDRALLEKLLKSEDRATARTAAKALYRGSRPAKRAPSDLERKRLERANMAAKPFVDISIDAMLRFALPERRTYAHRELTERLSAVCSDYSATRRYAVEEGVLERTGDDYRFTELGEAAWRVERHILDHYLRG